MTVTFKTRVHPGGMIAIPKKLKKRIRSKVVTVTVAEVTASRSRDIFDQWMKKSPFPADFKPLSRDEIYAGRCC
ncbi:MAG: hypothetical protein NTW87_20905 [Planctomycetota bacterium]|nr:hypothetical protein [Planctomycetota bacterium]